MRWERRLKRRVDRWLLRFLHWDAIAQLCSEIVELVVQCIDLVLQGPNMCRHIPIFLGIFEAIAAVRRIKTLEVQVAAALAWSLSVTFYLTTFAL